MNVRCTCPCCGYRTLNEGPAAYDLCPVCAWEDDGSQGDEQMSIGGPNGIPLAEAQRRYRRHGSSDLYALPKVRKPRPDGPRDTDWHRQPTPQGLDGSTADFTKEFGTLLYVRVRGALDRARATRSEGDIAQFSGLRRALELWVEQAEAFGIPLLDAGLPPQFNLDRELRLDASNDRYS